MKKLLLFALAAGIGVSAYAQNYKKTVRVDRQRFQAPVHYADLNPKATTAPTKKHEVNLNQNAHKGTRGDIEQVLIGKSGYIWSASASSSTCLDYNIGLNTITFTHRGEAGTYPGTTQSTILTSWSTDGGATFPNNMVVVDDSRNNRYPSGVLYNPPGNNDPSQAYIVVAGNSHTNSVWDNTYLASARLDGTNINVENKPFTATTQGSPRIPATVKDMCITDDGTVYLAADLVNEASPGVFTEYDLVVLKGTKGSNDTWTWERNVERIDLYPIGDGGEMTWLSAGLAFAKDGSIGYKWTVGRKADVDGGLQPILFYTEDAGATWTEIPVNFANNPVMSEYLLASDDQNGPVWPWFHSEIDAVVDANGNLQMFADVNSHGSTNPSEYNMIYGQKDKIFNITFNKTNGIEQVIFIDSLMGKDVIKSDCPDLCFGSTDDTKTGWNNRIQASISEDGQCIAVSWGDTPNADEEFEGFNGSPDLKGTGRHINNPFFYKNADESVPVFTSEDLYTGHYRFTFAARTGKRIIYDGYEPGDAPIPCLLVPMSGTVDINEWEANNALLPVTNYLINMDGLGGVPIPLIEGIAEMEVAANTFTVSQNQPNPFTGTTTITVSSNTVAPVSIEVSNIMGQTVFTQNEGTVNGSKEITIDASNLQAGIYFYTVTVGSESQTKKMMVK